MAVTGYTIAVGSTATLIYRQTKTTTGPVLIQNFDATNAICVGGPDVSRTNYGHTIAKASAEQSLSLSYGEEVYACSLAGATPISVGVLAVGQ